MGINQIYDRLKVKCVRSLLSAVHLTFLRLQSFSQHVADIYHRTWMIDSDIPGDTQVFTVYYSLNVFYWRLIEEKVVLAGGCVQTGRQAESNSQSFWKEVKCYFNQLTVQDRNYSDLWQ